MKKQTNYFKATILVAALLLTKAADAQIVAFQFASPKTTGNEANIAASKFKSGLKVAPLERGEGLYVNTEGGLIRSMVSSTKIETTACIADTSIAVAKDMYFKFAVTVDQNYKAKLTNLDYRVRASGGGAKVYYWKYSVDGKTFNKLAEPVKITPAAGEGQLMPKVELSAIKSLQDIKEGTTVTFRLYTNGSNTTTGTTAIGRSATGSSDDYAIALEGNVEKK